MRAIVLLLSLLLVAPAAAQTTDTVPPQIDWDAGAPLPFGRDHHATFLVQSGAGDYLYAAGGTDYRVFFADVVRARIGADGALGAWEAAGSLPTPRGGTSVAVVNGVAVLTGGQITTDTSMRSLKRIDEVYTARIADDGTLGAWAAAPALPAARFHHPAVAHNGWIYVVGGQGAREAEAGVFAAQVAADGSISGWTEARPLPRARSHHAAFVEAGHLYVVGGLDGIVGGHQALFTDMIRAPINEDGTLGEWRLVSRLPHSYATHAGFGANGYLWLVGGVEDNMRFVATVLRAELRADGRIGPWQEVPPGLPLARGHVHNTPVLNGRVYSAGGRTMTGVTAESHIGVFR